MEELARIAKEGVPKPLSPSQVDPVSGKIEWPNACRAPVSLPSEVPWSRCLPRGPDTAARLLRSGEGPPNDRRHVWRAEDADQTYSAAGLCREPYFLQSLTYAASKSELE